MEEVLPPQEQGVKLLGTPLGHAASVQDQLARLSNSQDVLLERIQAVPDLQVAWLLLVFCAASRANYNLRVVHPDWPDFSQNSMMPKCGGVIFKMSVFYTTRNFR